ncbi:MipA/OmpV family protein [Paraferrimonas haliotis]|uniref:Outer membrane protein n=1 Tax=Paraferrimonas haliotis TaxID=2013866 RepID=A0AA37TJK1_9GAMM|nr:MipA/OmpV family protein [Paraferrimonas haliotis]GLS82409.1 hypothetical protein GCM10007894_03860 [Paraferrimonas haliotis]
MKKISQLTAAAILAAAGSANIAVAEEASAKSTEPPAPWGIGIGVRQAQIPYNTEIDKVADVIPLFIYKGERFYIDGLEGGAHLWKKDGHQLNLFGKYRFFDVPKEYQNQTQADALDSGLQYRYESEQDWYADISLLSDTRGHPSVLGRVGKPFKFDSLYLHPYAETRWKSSQYNSYYYGLDLLDVDSGFSYGAGVKASYHVVSNLHLIAQIGVTQHEKSLTQLPMMNQSHQVESFLGFGFFPTEEQKTNPIASNPGEYIRVSHGWATPSNLNEILKFKTRKDPYNNQMTSVFYGFPLADNLFTLPLDVYFTTGIGHHQPSEVQDRSWEGVLAVKAYYTIDWPRKWRFGVAEGLSYVSQVTYIERTELDAKDYRPSKLLNYLDFSFDINIGDWFNSPKLNQLWLGWSIHHRSGIFETSSAFGRIKGGSNYNTVYLQWHF